MSLWHIAWGYMWSRKLTTTLTILSVALGVGLISSVHTLRQETITRLREEGQAFDVVVGAKGSPLQLVLSSVYYMDTPTGNISNEDYERLKQHPSVAAVFPIGLGDTYRGLRIVGTDRALMDFEWDLEGRTRFNRDPFRLAEGRFFETAFEAVVGSIAARETGLDVGDTFISTHGFMEGTHDEFPYTVVGILEPGGTPNDRAIFTDMESMWQAHADHYHDHDEEGHAASAAVHDHDHAHDHDHGEEHVHDEDHAHEHAHDDGHAHGHGEKPGEITAALLMLDTPAARFSFVPEINETMRVMAAVPVREVQKLYDRLVQPANSVLLAVAFLVVIVSALTIMIGLYLSIFQRRHDLAVMRALGASTWDIFGAILIEAFLVTILGIAIGWLLGNAVSWALGVYMTQRFGMTITAFGLSVDEVQSFLLVAIVGFLAGILPAWQAYRTNVAANLIRTN